MTRRGFTLIELIMVVIVIGILVSIAVPTYLDTVERTKSKEAIATLQSILAAERNYAAERRVFRPAAQADDSAWLSIGMDNPNNNSERAFNYVINSSTDTDFIASATRNSGPYLNNYITIDHNGALDTTHWPLN